MRRSRLSREAARAGWLALLVWGLLSSGGRCDEPGRNRAGDAMVKTVFAPFRVKDLAIAPGESGGPSPQAALRWMEEEGVEVAASGAFVLRGQVGKDLCGYRGIEFGLKAPPGELVLEIEDCLGRVWSRRQSLQAGLQSVRCAFSEFDLVNPEGQGEWSEPASVERLVLKYQPEREGEYSFRWRSFSPFGSKGLAGPSISIDPLFQLYREQPWSEFADLAKSEGHTNAVIVFTRVLPEVEHREIVDAFHAAALKCTLRINPPTDFEAYEEHPEWRQRMLDGSSRHDWRVYLCPNEEGFADDYCAKVARLVQTASYDALLISELWYEVWGGPYPDNPTRGKYACLCDACSAKFQQLAGVVPRDLFDAGSPSYFEKTANASLYQTWCEFRVDSVNTFCRRIAEAARAARPGLSIGTMYLSDCTVEPGKTREYQAQDLEGALEASSADIVVIQDAWQDWTQKDLSPDFVKAYAEAYLERARAGNPDRIVQVHADIGSLPSMRRSALWMRRLSAHARLCGFDSPMYYEFSLNRSVD